MYPFFWSFVFTIACFTGHSSLYPHTSTPLHHFNSDLLLNDFQFKKKYIRLWNSLDHLIQAYHQTQETTNPADKLQLVNRISQFLPHPKSFAFLIHAFQLSQPNYPKIDPHWKIRALVLFQFSKTIQALPPQNQIQILKLSRQSFENDLHHRVVASASLSLTSHFKPPLKLNHTHNHPLFKKQKIASFLAQKILSLSPNHHSHHYLALVLSHTASSLNHHSLLIPLSILRKKPFPKKILNAIKSSIQSLQKNQNQP